MCAGVQPNNQRQYRQCWRLECSGAIADSRDGSGLFRHDVIQKKHSIIQRSIKSPPEHCIPTVKMLYQALFAAIVFNWTDNSLQSHFFISNGNAAITSRKSTKVIPNLLLLPTVLFVAAISRSYSWHVVITVVSRQPLIRIYSLHAVNSAHR